MPRTTQVTKAERESQGKTLNNKSPPQTYQTPWTRLLRPQTPNKTPLLNKTFESANQKPTISNTHQKQPIKNYVEPENSMQFLYVMWL
jgi:hypothetical protein